MKIRSSKKNSGVTLVELMVVVAVLGIFFSVGPQLVKNTFRVWKLTETRTHLQRDARTTMVLIEGLLKRASAQSVTLTRHAADQPPYSKIEFQIPDSNGDIYRLYQLGENLWIYHEDPNGVVHSRIIAERVRYIAFAYPQLETPNLLSVALCFEESLQGNEKKNFYLSTQRIEVMNS